MYYLFLLTFGVIWLKYSSRVKVDNFLQQCVVWLPLLVMYCIPLFLQNAIGMDYHTYYDYYSNLDHFRYKINGEITFYYLVEIARFLGHAQITFVVVGLLQTIFIFYSFFLLKKIGYQVWLLFLLFIAVTGIYHNQMNGLRQFVVVNSMLLISFYLVKKRRVTSLNLSLLGITIHKTSILATLPLFFINKVITDRPGRILLIFVLSGFLYAVNLIDFIEDLIRNYFTFFRNYLGYFEEGNDFNRSSSLSLLVTKSYYVPAILYFYILLYKKRIHVDNFALFCAKIVAVTYFLYLQANYFHLSLRIWQYFNIFAIVLLYHLTMYFYRDKYKFRFLVLCIYLTLPYLYKILVFASAEYDFQLIGI